MDRILDRQEAVGMKKKAREMMCENINYDNQHENMCVCVCSSLICKIESTILFLANPCFAYCSIMFLFSTVLKKNFVHFSL